MKKITVLVAVIAVLVMGIANIIVTYYTTQLSLSLEGEKTITIGLNGIYEEKGATALVAGKDVSDRIKVSGEVDTSTPGVIFN